ncbi:MAG: hypothetical protein ACR2HE_05915 [Casimicrobiaceae bacterium]
MNFKSSQTRPARVVIEISGGNLQAVFSSMPIEIVVVDHDNIEAGDPGIDQLCFAGGALVSRFMTKDNLVF